MGKVYERIDERLREFIAAQPVFFVATAPSSGGHVNVSPKGYKDTFTIIDGRTVAYLDLYGSGAETVAHLRDDGRITIMFCSFDRQPKVLRLYGTGRVVTPASADWAGLRERFGERSGTRTIVVVDVERIADSCGYAVPRMDLAGERALLDDQHGRRTHEQWLPRVEVNARSIDGLPSLDPGHPVPTAIPRLREAAAEPDAAGAERPQRTMRSVNG